ncbi:lactate utilization protein C, partial [Nocardioides sp. CER28]
MSARDEILGRVRTALQDAPDSPPPAWTYGAGAAVADVPALFAERVEDYRATVQRVGAGQVADAVT